MQQTPEVFKCNRCEGKDCSSNQFPYNRKWFRDKFHITQGHVEKILNFHKRSSELLQSQTLHIERESQWTTPPALEITYFNLYKTYEIIYDCHHQFSLYCSFLCVIEICITHVTYLKTLPSLVLSELPVAVHCVSFYGCLCFIFYSIMLLLC